MTNESSERLTLLDVLSFFILVILTIISFITPIIIPQTYELELFNAIPLVFWIAVFYGLVFPLIKRLYVNRKIAVMWGATVFCLIWSYFTAAEPGLRYWDSWIHSRTTEVLMSHGIVPDLQWYLVWPLSFILHSIFSQVLGISVLATSKVLAIIFTFLTGMWLMILFSVFLNLKKAFLCLYLFTIMPNYIMAVSQHYCPQTVAYFFSILTIFLLCRSIESRSRRTTFVLVIVLFSIVLTNPTTTIILIPLLFSFLVALRFLIKPSKSLANTPILVIYLVFTATWWLFPTGACEVFASHLAPMLKSFVEAISTGNIYLGAGHIGIFRPSYPPYYVVLIRQVTFAFIGVWVMFSVVALATKILKRSTGPLVIWFSRDEVLIMTGIIGSIAFMVPIWIATGGFFGERTWGILALFLSILCVASMDKLSRIRKTKTIATFLVITLVIFVPLNLLTVRYDEALAQTTLADTAAINFMYVHKIYNKYVLADDLRMLLRFTYAIDAQLNFFMAKESQDLNTFTDNNFVGISWTFFIHSNTTRLFFKQRYGVEVNKFRAPEQAIINKVYDNHNIRLYWRLNSSVGP